MVMKTNDEFLAIVDEYMGPIQLVYDRFSAERPVLEIELPRRLIRAYPYLEYLKTLSPRSQKSLKREYALAASKRQIVLFVRDNETKRLKSCLLPIEPIDDPESVPGAWVEEQDAPPARRPARRRAVRKPRATDGP